MALLFIEFLFDFEYSFKEISQEENNKIKVKNRKIDFRYITKRIRQSYGESFLFLIALHLIRSKK